MDLKLFGFDSPLFNALQRILDSDDSPKAPHVVDSDNSANSPAKTYIRGANATMATMPEAADVNDLPDALEATLTEEDVNDLPDPYLFLIDMPDIISATLDMSAVAIEADMPDTMSAKLAEDVNDLPNAQIDMPDATVAATTPAADVNDLPNTQIHMPDPTVSATTPAADVNDLTNAYLYVFDMAGLKSGDIKVQVEDDTVLVVTGKRKRVEEEEEEEEGVKYVRMERQVGKFRRKFVLPENAKIDAISAVCQDGALTVNVEKLPPPPPPPRPKKLKTIEVKFA